MPDHDHSGSGAIRTITLEFLRAGPPHNQLLSPLTQYLAICGEAGATVVNVPWEHARFERRLEELRYEDGTDDDTGRRMQILQDTGREIAQLLGSIPALSGVISNDSPEGGLIHLRLVLSASELGLIPFELSKIPAGLQLPADNWLLLQANTPMTLTRHIRSVQYEGSDWTRRPRVLFVTADPEEIPYDRHLEALVDAVSPWLEPGQEKGMKRDGARRYGKVLTVLADAKLDQVRAECERHTYTHVHVLAHGAEDDMADYRTFGVGLGGEIVSGSRFASALTTFADGSVEQPCVVTLAVCDGGNIGSVVAAGASFAHSLHERGIPLVVASQFPLSFDGSEVAVRHLYGGRDGLLWGRDPRLMLQDLRRELQIRTETDSHDWASLVVYEAFPPDLAQQLEQLDHEQANRARSAAEQRIKAVNKSIPTAAYEDLEKDLRAATSASSVARKFLRTKGKFRAEGLARSGSNYKTLAESEFLLSQKPRIGAKNVAKHLQRCLSNLDRAFDRYRQAVDLFLESDSPKQMRAQPHYVVTQALAMGTVMGKDLDAGLWSLARLSARAYLRSATSEERAWAYGSLAELELLSVADPRLSTEASQQKVEERAIDKVRQFVELFSDRGAFPVWATYQQFHRYTHWWGSIPFLTFLSEQGVVRSWAKGRKVDPQKQVIQVATRIKDLLATRMWKNQIQD